MITRLKKMASQRVRAQLRSARLILTASIKNNERLLRL
jgi:hypothetical protein